MWCFRSSLVPAHIRLGKLLVTRKKKHPPNGLCLTFVMTGIQWEKEKKRGVRGGRGRGKNGGVAEGDRCVKLYVWKKLLGILWVCCNSHFFLDEEDRGGFPVIVTLCRESSGSRTKWFTENGIFYIGVSNSARRPCGGILFVCFYWSLHWARPKALTGGPRGRLSSPPNHKMERRSSLCALNYTPQHPLSHADSQTLPSPPKK